MRPYTFRKAVGPLFVELTAAGGLKKSCVEIFEVACAKKHSSEWLREIRFSLVLCVMCR